TADVAGQNNVESPDGRVNAQAGNYARLCVLFSPEGTILRWAGLEIRPTSLAAGARRTAPSSTFHSLSFRLPHYGQDRPGRGTCKRPLSRQVDSTLRRPLPAVPRRLLVGCLSFAPLFRGLLHELFGVARAAAPERLELPTRHFVVRDEEVFDLRQQQ